MATHSSVLAWRIPGMGEPGGLRLWGRTESDTTEATQQQQQQRVTETRLHSGNCYISLMFYNSLTFLKLNLGALIKLQMYISGMSYKLQCCVTTQKPHCLAMPNNSS